MAEKEVEKMTCELLSADDLQCADVRATVHQVASVAGQVLADNVQTQEQVIMHFPNFGCVRVGSPVVRYFFYTTLVILLLYKSSRLDL